MRRHSINISRSGSTPTPALYNGAAGYQSDSATGLQLLGHRYYDPSIGRFLSSDPAQAGTNWYAYCDNNPLGRVDPTGYNWLTNIWNSWSPTAKVIGGAIGIGLGAITGITLWKKFEIAKIDVDERYRERKMINDWENSHGPEADPTPLWDIYHHNTKKYLKDIGHTTGSVGQDIWGKAAFGHL